MADFDYAAKVLYEAADELKERATGYDTQAAELRARAAELAQSATDARKNADAAISAAVHLVPPVSVDEESYASSYPQKTRKG